MVWKLDTGGHGNDRFAYQKASYNSPTVNNSMIPGLLGLVAMSGLRGIIDTVNFRFYAAGPGDFDLLKALPPGTKCIVGERAPSGHFAIPCGYFHEFDEAQRLGGLEVEEVACAAFPQED